MIIEIFKKQAELNKKIGGSPNWALAIMMECAELIDNFNWKWWGSSSKVIDWDNVKLEVIDILHFGVSLELSNRLYHEMDQMYEVLDRILSRGVNPDKIQDVNAIIQCTLPLANNALSGYFNWEVFATLMGFSGLNKVSMYDLYLAKNVLNKLRHDHKDNYQKIWNGKEDNHYLFVLSLIGSGSTEQEMYDTLHRHYHQLTGD